jgi:hypothetical protein
MKCEICGKGIDSGITIYRKNKPGEMPAIWRCVEHLDFVIAPDLLSLVAIIEEADPKNKRVRQQNK